MGVGVSVWLGWSDIRVAGLSGACDYSVELPHWSYCSWFDVCWSFGVVGLEWYPCRKLLMMDILMSETCWAHKKWNKIVTSSWNICCSYRRTKSVSRWHTAVKITSFMNFARYLVFLKLIKQITHWTLYCTVKNVLPFWVYIMKTSFGSLRQRDSQHQDLLFYPEGGNRKCAPKRQVSYLLHTFLTFINFKTITRWPPHKVR